MSRRKRMLEHLEEEMRDHIERETQDNLDRGMSPAEARRAAGLKFGNLALAREDTRAVWTPVWLEQLLRDIRIGFRMLRKSPGFTVVAILILALGIGVSTAIFSVFDAVMLRSLPVRDPGRLVLLEWEARGWPQGEYSSYYDCKEGQFGSTPAIGCSFALPVLDRIRARPGVFSGLAAFTGPMGLELSGRGLAGSVSGEIVSGDYFSTLGVRAFLGRTLVPSDDVPGAAPATVLSYGYWRSAFGGERSAVGRTIFLNKVAFTVVGVADPGFTNLVPGKTQDLWLPIAAVLPLKLEGGMDVRGLDMWWLTALGRLKPDVTRRQAAAAASAAFSAELAQAGKAQDRMKDPGVKLVAAREGLTGLRAFYAGEVSVFFFATGMILLIACANVAGLFVARARNRRKEMAVRRAIGAGPWRIARQLLTESVLLSGAAGLLGIFVAYAGVKAITPFLAGGAHRRFPFPVSPDWRVLCFVLGTSVLAGICFGLAPAMAGTRFDLTPALKENASTCPGAAPKLWRPSLGNALVLAQVALSAVALIGAGLLVRTLADLRAVNPGFDPRNVLLFEARPSRPAEVLSNLESLYTPLRDRLAALPGVAAVGFSQGALLGGGWSGTSVSIEGRPDESDVQADVWDVGPGFLSTMRIPVLEGRGFDAAEFQPSPKTVLVNEAFLQHYLGKANPLGRQLSGKWRIIGVVGDTKYSSLRREIQPAIYLPSIYGPATFEVRTSGDPLTLAPVVRQIVTQVSPSLEVEDVRTQTAQIDEILWRERSVARLAGFFALLALLLACIGLYGLLSYEVARRTRDIGIRMALGAQPGDLMRMILRRAMAVTVLGCCAGIAISLGMTRYLASFLYGVKPIDPATLAAVGLLLVAVAIIAGSVPARRALRVDPAAALRRE